MDKEIMEQFGLLAQMMEKMDTRMGEMETRLDAKISGLDTRMGEMEIRLDARITGLDNKIDSVRSELREEIHASEKRTLLFVENRVIRKVDGIYESMLGVQEHQQNLEQRVTVIEAQMA